MHDSVGKIVTYCIDYAHVHNDAISSHSPTCGHFSDLANQALATWNNHLCGQKGVGRVCRKYMYMTKTCSDK